jgi:hypothetical protein
LLEQRAVRQHLREGLVVREPALQEFAEFLIDLIDPVLHDFVQVALRLRRGEASAGHRGDGYSHARFDGIAAAREIRDKHPQVKIIGLSEYAYGYNTDAMEKAGALGIYLNPMPWKNYIRQ